VETAEAVATLTADPDYRVLHRLAVAGEHVFAGNVTGEACARLAVIDTETCGWRRIKTKSPCSYFCGPQWRNFQKQFEPSMRSR
jgi:hypothetical protein